MAKLPTEGLFYSFLYAGRLESEERYKRFDRLAEIITWAALILGVLIIQLPFAENLDKKLIYTLDASIGVFVFIWYRLVPKKLSGRVRSLIYDFIVTLFIAFLIHNTGGVQSYIIFLYFLVSLRIGMILPLVHTVVSVLFIVALIIFEAFLTPGSLATNLSLTALHSTALVSVVFLGRFYSGEAALANEREENVILEKEKTLGRLKDEFVSVISRELKQPTTAIKGYIDNIFSNYPKDFSSEARELLERTSENNDRLGKLLNDLLDVSQIEKEGLKVNVSNVFLNPILGEVMSNQFFDAKAKRISITQRGETDIAVNADGDRLKEVVTNLISNAIKYTPEGGKVVVNLENEGEFAKVSVTDNGFGISQEDQKHLFEKFYRIENEQTKSVKGSGLGLFITKNLVEKMGGEIGVISKIGEGTTFFFRLPRYRW